MTAAALLLPAVAVAAEETAAIEEIAANVVDRIEGGGRLFTFGAGHSSAIAMELCSRAGGLADVTSMSLEDLRTEPRPAHVQLADSEPERDPANGVALVRRYGVGAADALLVVSQSGRNGATVEAARVAREAGAYTAAVVSLAHCRAFPSRHPDGLTLPDVVDRVVDNHCPVGDAGVTLEDGQRVAATSTIAGALAVQLLNAAMAAELRGRGVPPRVITSANVGGAR